jgi:tRNA modification GTPase
VTETLAARLTPAGTGAIATIALRGPSAWSIARKLFRPRRDGGRDLPEHPEAGRVWPGRFGADPADDVVLAVRQIEPFPWVEVHSHGGRQVVQLFLEALTQRGVRVCDAVEFHRLVLPSDPLRESAEGWLLQAPTLRAAAILLRQRQGHFRVALETILASLQHDAASAQVTLARLAQFAPVGRHLVHPWQVTIAGAPNVGKSSLVNALTGYQRCIVSPTPGTTRDVVTTRIALNGWPVELADTAGLREQPGELEGQGIARARVAAASADLCLWVLDAAAEPTWPEASRRDALLVVNKIDLPPGWDLGRADGAVHVSARTGGGIPALCEAIVRRLVPSAPGPDEAVPFAADLCDAVEQAYTQCMAGRLDEARLLLRALLV